MKTRVLFLLFTLLSATRLFARAKTDVLVLNNGDHITCEIKGLNEGVLSIGIDYVDGTVSVDWLKVKYLESNQLFVVLTQDGSSYEGKLATSKTAAEEAMRIRILEGAEQGTEIERSKIVRMTETSDRFYQRLNGSINFGVTYSKGNSATQYNLSSEVEYLRERWAVDTNLSSNLTSSSGAAASTRNQLGLFGYHLLPWENYFYAGLGNFLQSSVQGINLQTTLGGGIGHFFKNSNRASIAVLGGLGWQSTDYKPTLTPVGTQNVASALVAAQIKLFKFSKTNLDVTASLLPALSQPGRVHFNMNATYYLKLFSNLKWNTSFYGSWDNRPPAGLAGSDYGTSSGLSWTFGNR
jgi:Protein of unknown function, DUF481